MRGVVSQLIRCRSTTKTVPHLGQPFVVKAEFQLGTVSLLAAAYRFAMRLFSWQRLATYSLVKPCSVPFRDRSGFTSKTLTYHQQPYVVKLVFLRRHFMR